MRSSISRRKLAAGFTIIELMVALLVIGIASGVIYANRNRIFGMSSQQQMISDLNSAVTGIRNHYQNDPAGYADISSENLIKAKVLPSTFKPRGTNLADQFGQIMTFSAENGQGGGSGFFSITYPAVPAEICTKVLNALGSDSFIRIDVGGSTEFSDGSTDGTQKAYPGATKIATDCGDGSGNKSMTFFAN